MIDRAPHRHCVSIIRCLPRRGLLQKSVCLPDCLPACLPVCLPACLPTCLSACLPVCRSVCLPACPSACLPASWLPACAPVRLP
eukprot:4429731-Alexandrium_andersonii.AAC.1